MKLKRDIYRELFISSLFSLMIVSMTPNPIQLWLDKSQQNTVGIIFYFFSKLKNWYFDIKTSLLE